MISNNNSPLQVLTHYIECFDDAKETRSKLEFLLDTALSSIEVDDWSADERANLIFFCRQTQLLLAKLPEISEPLKKLSNEQK